MAAVRRHISPWSLLAVLLVLVLGQAVQAGSVEDRPDGTTVIHVGVYELPDPAQTDLFTRAEVAAVRLFVRQFPTIFAQRYRAKYKAHPEIYGRHHWSHVRIKLEPFNGVHVKGVEPDLLAIAGGVAPDVLYVNFSKSDHYIQNGFLYPLDKPADHYFSALTPAEVRFHINPKR